MDPRTERKLGRAVLEVIFEIQNTPHDNVTRFLYLQKRLAKAVDRYREYTGRDKLLPDTDYGYRLQ
jgi:hypothetical protein